MLIYRYPWIHFQDVFQQMNAQIRSCADTFLNNLLAKAHNNETFDFKTYVLLVNSFSDIECFCRVLLFAQSTVHCHLYCTLFVPIFSRRITTLYPIPATFATFENCCNFCNLSGDSLLTTVIYLYVLMHCVVQPMWSLHNGCDSQYGVRSQGRLTQWSQQPVCEDGPQSLLL